MFELLSEIRTEVISIAVHWGSSTSRLRFVASFGVSASFILLSGQGLDTLVVVFWNFVFNSIVDHRDWVEATSFACNGEKRQS